MIRVQAQAVGGHRPLVEAQNAFLAARHFTLYNTALRSIHQFLSIPMDFETGSLVTQYPWYAVQVRTKYEKKVADALAGKGYECLLPSYRQRRNWSDRVKVIELPLFPGYVFSRFDVEIRLPILTIPGVVGVLGIGKVPKPLDDREIAQIRQVTRVGYPAQPWPYLKIGHKVRIVAGPLTGVEGLLAQQRGETHVVLSLTHLQKSMSVIVESDAIRPAT